MDLGELIEPLHPVVPWNLDSPHRCCPSVLPFRNRSLRSFRRPLFAARHKPQQHVEEPRKAAQKSSEKSLVDGLLCRQGEVFSEPAATLECLHGAITAVRAAGERPFLYERGKNSIADVRPQSEQAPCLIPG